MPENDFDKYQEDAEVTSGMAGRHDEERLIYAVLAIGGEVGELQNYIKKGIWHGHGVDKGLVKEEISDVLWYISEIASCLEFRLSDVAEFNIAKLSKRYPNGWDEERSRNRQE